MKFVAIVAFIILLFSVKAVVGNPDPMQIFLHLRDAGMPFELSPERNRYAQLMMFYDNRSFNLTHDLARMVTPDLGYANGKFVSIYPPGVSVFALPFYIIGRLLGLGQLFAFLTSAVFSVASFVLIVRICKRLQIDEKYAVTAGFLFLFGTPLWAYSTTLYQHAITTFLLLCMARMLLSKASIKNSILVWVLYSLAGMVDYPNFLLLFPLAAAYFLKYTEISFKDRVFDFRLRHTFFVTLVGLMPIFGIWGFYNYMAFGNPTTISKDAISVRRFDENDQPVLSKSVDGSSTFTMFKASYLPRNLQVLILSRDRGLVFYTPFLLLSVLGVKQCMKKYRNFTIATLITAGTILLLYGLFNDPWGGWASGPRYLIPMFAILTIFLAATIQTYIYRVSFIVLLTMFSTYSLITNALGALTSNQLPPAVEAGQLHMGVGVFQNIEYLRQGIVGAFIYTNFLKVFMSPFSYVLLIAAVVAVVNLILIVRARKV